MPTRGRAEYSVMRRDGENSSMEGAHLEQQQLLGDGEWKPGKQEYAVMCTIALISLMVALDATILVSVLPTLAIDLGGEATDAFWAGTSYLLTCAVCQPFIAALSDIFGRKEMLIASVLFFTFGTILCAPIAKNFTVFFAGRSVQGIGGGGIITMGQVIFADIVPLRQRPKYFSLVLAAWALGSVLGPLIGGLFVEHAFWSWCFYINFPFCALGLVMVPLFVKLSTKRTSLASKLGRVDWVGGFLFIGGLTSFLVGMSWAGVQYQWKSVQVLVPMLIGVASVVASVFWECYGAREPFLRPSLFHSPSALAAYACALFQGFILFCALYYVPFYFTSVRFSKPTQAGLDIFPVTCLLLPGSIIVSLITTRTGHYRWAIWIGWAITAVGCGLLRLFDQDTPTPVWAVILAIFGIGHGMLLTSVNVGIQAIVKVEDAGRAAAMYAFMRTLGMSIGVAVGGTVFQNMMSGKLKDLGLPEQIAHDSEAFVVEMALMDPEDPVRVGALEAYVVGFQGVYWTIFGASVAALLVSLVMKRYSMDKLLESNFVLEGGRTPQATASNLAIITQNIDNSNSRSEDKIKPVAENRLPNLFKGSPMGSPMPSAFDSESTYSVTNSKTEGDGVNPEMTESNETGVVVAAVAYFVEASGRIVPVDINPDELPVSRIGSVCYERQERYPSATYENMETEKKEEKEEEDINNKGDTHTPTPEELFELAMEKAKVKTDDSSLAEYEAIFADLAPAWMNERPVSGMP